MRKTDHKIEAAVEEKVENSAAADPLREVVLLQVNTYNFKKIRGGTIFKVIETDDIEHWIIHGYLIRLGTEQIEIADEDLYKYSFHYRTTCTGCGE